MTRFLLLLPILTLAPTCADAAFVPPIPRVIIPQDALPKPGDAGNDQPGEPPANEDPAKTAERIAKNAKALGDKLADQDTGPDTLTGQDRLKRDIDSLIKALENPPPMSNQTNPMPNPQGGQGQPDKNQSQQGGGSPMGGGGSPIGGGQRQSQQGSSGRQQGGNRGGQQPQPGGQGKQPGQADQKSGGQPMQPGGNQPMGGAKPDPKNPAGQPGDQQMRGGNQPGGGGLARPDLPLDEMIARDFWGNLPDLPRQRMLQFFREQYMSRYKELLPQYYQSLAEKEKKNKK